MPAPVPPPPPQPSVEETGRALRLVALSLAAFVALFLLFSIPYEVRGPMVEYGRHNGGSWNRYKLDRILKRKDLRAHPGGRIAWLVGSSILRDAFDEALMEELLVEDGSPYRVHKIGQTRGAAGISAGVARRLPLQPGDLVLHNVAMENYRVDWLAFTDLPGWRVQLWLKPSELWAIEEWSVAERTEELVAVPRDFYRFHLDHMEGVRRWLAWGVGLRDEKPRRKRRSYHIRYKRKELIDRLKRARRGGEESRYYLSPELVDLTGAQFNVRGLATLRREVAEDGAELVLVDVPPRQEYQATFLHDDVREIWRSWRAEQPELVYFPQQPEDDYYDMKHPNSRGREALSRYLVSWLQHRRVGAPAALSWPVDD